MRWSARTFLGSGTIVRRSARVARTRRASSYHAFVSRSSFPGSTVLAGCALVSGWASAGEGSGPRAGAEHWAYRPPERAPVPADPFGGWARNPIDRFVAARLAAEGLTPAPEADRATCLRRASLDLTGLPPALDELELFLADTAPDAWERALERLLASPRYGEHQARAWLDLARYADTRGYEKDERRTMWRWRDWVIEAFDRDLSFDRFTIEQLAGDLLPAATPDQLLATGFHRNTMVNQEGGADPEEFRVAAVKDRVHTTALVWLGTTLECAQCHDHKYDPFTQEDYYRLYACFDSTADTGGSDEPVIEAPNAAFLARAAELERERIAIEQELEGTPLEAEQRAWTEAWSPLARGWRVLRPHGTETRAGARLGVLDDGSVLSFGPLPDSDDYVLRASVGPDTVRRIAAVRIEVLTDESLPELGPGRAAHRNFVLSTVRLGAGGQALALGDARADFHQTGSGVFPPAGVLDEDPATGWAIAGGEGSAHALLLELGEPLELAGPTELELVLEQRYGRGHLLGRVRVSVGEEPVPEMEPVPAPEVDGWLADAARGAERTEALARWYRDRAPALARLRERRSAIAAELVPPTALVMRELPEPRRTRVLSGGNFLAPGQEVAPGTPAVLPPLRPRGARADRLDLARWLVDPANPLTARVTVNRVWQRLFGTGLVATDDDFGTRGERPSHPELLDWLALELIERGWSLKELHRLVLGSATYRQSSRVTPELLERDPANRLLARGPKLRLEAEVVRDVALAASGLLAPETGGPSVFPPQPEGIWQITYSADSWQTSAGTDRYRRGLYTFLRRTAPYPTFALFDATSRELACSRRARSNTPLQALALLNDPAFVECARALADRMLREAASPAERARLGFRLCTAREPEPAELQVLLGLYETERESYASRPEAARSLAGESPVAPGAAESVELAAWTVVANVLLNLDETITKG